MTYSVYILYSTSIDKYYVGYTSNVSERLEYHNSSRNIIWTKRGIPWELYHTIDRLERTEATLIEKHIKRMKSKIYIQNLKKYQEISDRLRDHYS